MEDKEQLFPFMEYFDDDFPFLGRMNPEVDKLTLEWLSPEDIFVTIRQKHVWNVDTLETILEDFCPGRIKSVNIARILGVNICWNGQHTIAAMLLNGWKKVPCMVYECEDMSWRTNTATHMRFSLRQRADMAFDTLQEVQQGCDPEMKTFADVMNTLYEIKNQRN